MAVKVRITRNYIKGKLPSAARIKTEAERAITRSAQEIAKDFRATVSRWDTPVGFRVSAFREGRDIYTDSDIYHFVNAGTRPHPIRGDRGLAFEFSNGPGRSYIASTRKGWIGSMPNRKLGDVVYFEPWKSVDHPGSEAREFDEAIYARHKHWVENGMIAAIYRILW